jgi:uncharacterized DUF497 family protein
MQYTWNEEKNKILKQQRNISFERICVAIEHGKILDILENRVNPEYMHQRIMLIEVDEYVWVVPFYDDIENGKRVLITAFPSRKYQRKFKS